MTRRARGRGSSYWTSRGCGRSTVHNARARRRSVAIALVVSWTLATLVVAPSLGWATQPLGNRNHYTLTHGYDGYLKRTVVVRWNPCATITYRVNAGLGGKGALSDARAAVAQLAAASGLHLQYLGTTTYIPTGKPVKFFGRIVYAFDPVAQRNHTGADLVIAWARPGRGAGRSALLSASGEDGVGGYFYQWSSTHRLRVTAGFAIIRSNTLLRSGFGRGITRGHFLLHELGHAVGLGHFNDGVQVMTAVWSAASASPAQYNAGDIAGLHRVGRAAGCIAP
jgi:hypothetical protein